MNIKQIYSLSRKLINRYQFILYFVIFAIIFLVFLWIQSTPTFLDPDSFYHLKITKLIYENRQPVFDFPYLQYTILNNFYIDHHFLYHVLAVPFVVGLGDLPGFKFYTVILSTIFVFFSYIFFKRNKIIYAEIFVLLLLTAPALLFRLSLAKATAISLIILFWGIYSIFKKKYWALSCLSFLYVWSYGGFLLILAVSGLYAVSCALYSLIYEGKSIKWRKKIFIFFAAFFSAENIKLLLSSFLGVAFGLVINPYFYKNLVFYWQQIVQIGIINFRGAVNVGGEWYPYNIFDLWPDSGAIIIFTVIALVVFFLYIKKQKPESIFFLLATLVFFALTLKSKRYVEYFIPFLVYFSAFSLTFALENTPLWEYLHKMKVNKVKPINFIYGVIIYLIIIIPVIMVKDVCLTRQTFRGGINFTRFSGISKFLSANSKAGDIVMHSSWDDFPMLFYYNDKNFYIVGLDPTFMYKFNPKLYNLYADITMANISTDLYSKIKNNFNASYFIVNSGRQQLEKNLILEGHFSKVYEDVDGKIFKLK